MFMQKTIDNVLENIEADTEVIAICDGYWPSPTINDNPRVVLVHHDSIGQRAATNEGIRLSQAKYVMKLDAHCSVDKGFDVKLIRDCQPDWVMVPQMYNLHAFDWECVGCKGRTYQGFKPEKCLQCNGTDFVMVEIWKPRLNKLTVSWRFDKDLHFQYWSEHGKRPECRNNKLIETMSFIGACMFCERKRYWEIDGLDEAHGSWGQFGTEIASKNTWFAHMFRTSNFSNGGSTWPYPMTQQAIEAARVYSKDIWLNNKWPKAIHPLSWLVERFSPVPGWEK
jgi:glycosyltransferase involved in cell wall biosynthesis